MNKLAQQEIYNHYYSLGNTAAVKTAGISMQSLRKALSQGSPEVLAITKAMGERRGGQLGSLGGAQLGIDHGLELAAALAEGNPLVASLLAGTGGTLGMAGGNIVGRQSGKLLGHLTGKIQQTAPMRHLGNLLADPLARVPGIRG